MNGDDPNSFGLRPHAQSRNQLASPKGVDGVPNGKFSASDKMTPYTNRMRSQVRAHYLLNDPSAQAQWEQAMIKMRKVLARKKVPGRLAERAIKEVLKAAVDRQFDLLNSEVYRRNHKHAKSELNKLVRRLKRLSKAISELSTGSRKNLRAVVALHVSESFDTEEFAALLRAMAIALPSMKPARLSNMILRLINGAEGDFKEPNAEVFLARGLVLVDLWEIIPAETRAAVELKVRQLKARGTASGFILKLAIMLKEFSPRSTRGRKSAVDRDFNRRALAIWRHMGLQPGRGSDADKVKKTEGSFQQFCSAALTAVDDGAKISTRQVRKLSKLKLGTRKKLKSLK